MPRCGQVFFQFNVVHINSIKTTFFNSPNQGALSIFFADAPSEFSGFNTGIASDAFTSLLRNLNHATKLPIYRVYLMV
jgi:hypothetical protein